MSVASFAQWVKPTYESYFTTERFAKDFKVSTATVEVDSTNVILGDTSVYYLYNIEAQAFLSNKKCATHAPWDSHGALNPKGNKVIIEQWMVAQDTLSAPEWDGKSYVIYDWYTDWHPTTKYWRFFPTSYYNTFVDWNNQSDFLWEIKPQGNGVFKIKVADANPNWNDANYGAESYLGFNSTDDDYINDPTVMPLVPMLAGENSYYIDEDTKEKIYYSPTEHVTWAFITEADYNYYFDVVIKTYDAAVALGATIDQVKAEHPSVNTAAAEAIYNDTNSTMEELVAAIVALEADARLALADEILVGATMDDPVDATVLLDNPTFEGNTDGWVLTYKGGTNATNLGYQSANYSNGEVRIEKFFEAWANSNFGNDAAGKRTLGDGKGYQLVKGLPAGMYKFTCDAIASRQDEANQGLEKGAYLYVKAGDALFKQMIGTNNNSPEHFELTFVNPEANDFELGFMTESTTCNWLAVDNFTLWYYGETTEDPYKAVLAANIDKIEKQYPEMDEIPANDSIKNELVQALTDAKACEEDFATMDSILSAKAKAYGTSVSDYNRMLNYMTQVIEKQEAFEESDFSGLGQELGDYYMELETAFDERTADAAYINQILDVMGKIIVEYITANVKPGDELTPLIKNPNFDEDFSGWSTTGARPAFGGKGGNGDNSIGDVAKLESGNAEVFHNTFDMFQLIKNMPKGSFKLTCQAFERNDSKQDYDPYDPEANINAVLYANEYTAKVHNVRAFAQREMIYMKGSDTGYPADSRLANFFGDGEDGYVPNSMDGANFYFNLSPETYMCEVNFTLAEAGDSITIGLKNTFNNSWVIFDNFRLFYNGDGVEAFAETFEKLTANLNALKEAGKPIYTGYAADIETALAKIEAAPATESSDSCIAAAAFAQATIDNVKASAKNYEALDAAYNAFANNLDEYAETAAKPVVMQATKVDATAINTIQNLDADNETVEALIKKLNELTKALARPAGQVIEDLTVNDFWSWTAADATAEQNQNINCDFNLNKNTQMVYGLSTVNYLSFADLSNYSEIILTYTVGTPRLLFNRTVNEGTVGYEYPRDESNGWSTVVDNGDGSKTLTIDITKIVERDGFAHLHAIKGANWADTHVTSMQVNKAGAPEEIWLGNEENTSPWWEDRSEPIELHEGETAEISFINYTDEVDNWFNWVLVTNVVGTEFGGPNYSEYYVLRADAYGWGEKYDASGLKHNFNFDTFKSDMNGATVKMTLELVEGAIVMKSTITTIDGSKTYNYEFTSKNIDANAFSFFFTLERAHICNFKCDITGVPTAIETVPAVAKKANGKYIENGKVVIVKNGKKYNVAGSLIK